MAGLVFGWSPTRDAPKRRSNRDQALKPPRRQPSNGSTPRGVTSTRPWREARRHDQSQMGVRAGASATQAGTRPPHFEGRSSIRIPKHALMTMIACAFFQSRRLTAAGQKNDTRTPDATTTHARYRASFLAPPQGLPPGNAHCGKRLADAAEPTPLRPIAAPATSHRTSASMTSASSASRVRASSNARRRVCIDPRHPLRVEESQSRTGWAVRNARG
jgi:hypothetical protein